MSEYDRRDSGYRQPQRGYRDSRAYPGDGYGRSSRQDDRDYARSGRRDEYIGGRRYDDRRYDERRAPGYTRSGSSGYGSRSSRPAPRYDGYSSGRAGGYAPRDDRYRQEQYRRPRAGYADYDDYDEYYEGHSHAGLLIFLSILLLLAAASCVAVIKISNVFKLVEYNTPTDIRGSAYEISASDLMAWLPDDGMTGEPIAVSDTDALMSELLASRCPENQLRDSETVSNILIVEGESADDPADIFVLVSINDEQRLVTFTTIMPETMVAYEGMDAPVRLSCSTLIHGPEAAEETIQALLGVKTDGYFFIDDNGFSSVCDAVGKVPVNLSDEQLSAVNRFIDLYEGESALIGSAKAELNGEQLILYSRLAGTPDDHRISERRASALYYMACNLKQASLKELATTFKKNAENCSTDMARKELTSLAAKYRKLKAYDVVTDVIPSDAEYTQVSVDGRMMLKINDIERCRSRLYNGAYEGAYRNK